MTKQNQQNKNTAAASAPYKIGIGWCNDTATADGLQIKGQMLRFECRSSGAVVDVIQCDKSGEWYGAKVFADPAIYHIGGFAAAARFVDERIEYHRYTALAADNQKKVAPTGSAGAAAVADAPWKTLDWTQSEYDAPGDERAKAGESFDGWNYYTINKKIGGYTLWWRGDMSVELASGTDKERLKIYACDHFNGRRDKAAGPCVSDERVGSRVRYTYQRGEENAVLTGVVTAAADVDDAECHPPKHRHYWIDRDGGGVDFIPARNTLAFYTACADDNRRASAPTGSAGAMAVADGEWRHTVKRPADSKWGGDIFEWWTGGKRRGKVAADWGGYATPELAAAHGASKAAGWLATTYDDRGQWSGEGGFRYAEFDKARAFVQGLDTAAFLDEEDKENAGRAPAAPPPPGYDESDFLFTALDGRTGERRRVYAKPGGPLMAATATGKSKRQAARGFAAPDALAVIAALFAVGLFVYYAVPVIALAIVCVVEFALFGELWTAGCAVAAAAVGAVARPEQKNAGTDFHLEENWLAAVSSGVFILPILLRAGDYETEQGRYVLEYGKNYFQKNIASVRFTSKQHPELNRDDVWRHRVRGRLGSRMFVEYNPTMLKAAQKHFAALTAPRYVVGFAKQDGQRIFQTPAGDETNDANKAYIWEGFKPGEDAFRLIRENRRIPDDWEIFAEELPPALSAAA